MRSRLKTPHTSEAEGHHARANGFEGGNAKCVGMRRLYALHLTKFWLPRSRACRSRNRPSSMLSSTTAVVNVDPLVAEHAVKHDPRRQQGAESGLALARISGDIREHLAPQCRPNLRRPYLLSITATRATMSRTPRRKKQRQSGWGDDARGEAQSQTPPGSTQDHSGPILDLSLQPVSEYGVHSLNSLGFGLLSFNGHHSTQEKLNTPKDDEDRNTHVGGRQRRDERGGALHRQSRHPQVCRIEIPASGRTSTDGMAPI